MSKVIEDYLLQEVIGSGQYGKVYRAKNLKTDQEVAIKVVKLGKFKEVPKLYEFTMNEIQTLTRIENVNIIKFIEMLRTSNNMYLIYEFCKGGTLENLLNRVRFLSERDALDIFKQILNSFKSLVKENILHRDLKPSNILIHDNIIKVADFGFCKALLGPRDMTQTMVGSPIYMAPEILKGCNYSIKADIWSMGVVLYEMLFGFCPYEDRSIASLINQIDNKQLIIPRHINPISKRTEDLLRRMLIVDPDTRIDWNSLLAINLDDEEPLQPSRNPQIYGQMHINLNSSNLDGSGSFEIDKKSFTQGANWSMNNDSLILKQAFTQNLKILIRERNKIVFMTNALSAVLDNKINSKTPLIGFLIMKNIMSNCDSLKEMVKNILNNNSEKSTLGKKMEKLDLFVNSGEFRSFLNVFNNELQKITGCLEVYKTELNKVLTNVAYKEQSQKLQDEIQKKELNSAFFYKSVISYVEDLKEKYKSDKDKENVAKKWLLLANDCLDVMMVEEFLENLIDENLRYNEQKYFENMRNYTRQNLEELLFHKLEYAKTKTF